MKDVKRNGQPTFWAELREVLQDGFTGQIVLHVSEGRVLKCETRQTWRPKAAQDTCGFDRQDIELG